MRKMMEQIGLSQGMQILDLGGTPEIWSFVDTPLQITLVNLQETKNSGNLPGQHKFESIIGDACDLADLSGRDFDFVFSNSVIEHVGDLERQQAFARQVLALNVPYWIQTPAIWFPIEAHTGMPFWWFYPQILRTAILRRWARKLPAWTKMVEGTRVIPLQRLRDLFPGAEIFVERVAGIPKSYTAYRSGRRH